MPRNFPLFSPKYRWRINMAIAKEEQIGDKCASPGKYLHLVLLSSKKAVFDKEMPKNASEHVPASEKRLWMMVPFVDSAPSTLVFHQTAFFHIRLNRIFGSKIYRIFGRIPNIWLNYRIFRSFADYFPARWCCFQSSTCNKAAERQEFCRIFGNTE